jgi:leader peptidase (prepilin peptidase)/N-methyltransferase
MIIIILLIGLVLSFIVNFLCDALPLTVDDQQPRAFGPDPVCIYCRENKSWRSFLLLRNCEHCQKPVALRAWIVLIGMPLMACLAYFFAPGNLNGWLMIVLLFYFSIVAIIDISHRIILRVTTFIGWALAFGLGYLVHGLPLTLLGGASGLIVMLILYFAGVFFSRMMAKRKGEPVDEALGFGDVYISIMAGFILGFPNVFSAILLAILMGGVISLGLLIFMLTRKDYQPFTPIPYAPFIILATLVLMYR